MCFSMLMSNRRCKRERRRQSECPTRIVFRFSTTLSLSFYSCALSLFLSNAHTALLHGEEWKSKAERGGHTATFLSVLCWLSWTLPLRSWWGGMALWKNQPGASIAVIIIWIQECWICSFGPLRGWEMTCLCSSDTLSVCSKTTHPPSTTTLRCSTPVSTGRWVLLECKDWCGSCMKPATMFSICAFPCDRGRNTGSW